MVLRVPALLVLAVLAAAVAGEAQPAGTPRIGYLGNGKPMGGASREAFLLGLRERGWIEGRTVTIEYRWAEGDPTRLPALVAELVRARVDVLVVSGTSAIRAARTATPTLPIVFVSLADPVRLGFITSLARPGTNATGLASQYEEIITKQLELLRETVPTVSRVALLHHAEIADSVLSEAVTAAQRLGLAAPTLKVGPIAELERALKAVRSERAEALHVLPSPFFNAHRRRLIDLVAHHRLPAVYEFKEFVDDGGLLSYGPNIVEMFRGLAGHVDRILRGARPGELPVERPARFELAVNLKTARALGLTIPQSVLLRADAVVQ